MARARRRDEGFVGDVAADVTAGEHVDDVGARLEAVALVPFEAGVHVQQVAHRDVVARVVGIGPLRDRCGTVEVEQSVIDQHAGERPGDRLRDGERRLQRVEVGAVVVPLVDEFTAVNDHEGLSGAVVLCGGCHEIVEIGHVDTLGQGSGRPVLGGPAHALQLLGERVGDPGGVERERGHELVVAGGEDEDAPGDDAVDLVPVERGERAAHRTVDDPVAAGPGVEVRLVGAVRRRERRSGVRGLPEHGEVLWS